MSRRLLQVIACWFVLQITLPFTAPLQTLELHDLFGTKTQHALTSSPESTTTPTISEASSTTAAVSVLTPTAHDALDPSESIGLSSRALLESSGARLPNPQVQRSVLRL
jgi:hypothetical protein